MIPVTIIKAIYIRKGPGRSFDNIGVIEPSGKQVNMDGMVAGESLKGVSSWYYRLNTNGDKQYYWGGGLSTLLTPKTPPGGTLPAQAVVRTTFPWFENLQVKQIWDAYGTTGVDTTVAVLDTGYDVDNTDVANAIKAANLFVNNAAGTATINDHVGHGTYTASLIGARNMLDYNIGIAPNCDLLVGKISLIGETCPVSTMLDAITWSVNNGADIISVSFSIDITDTAAIAAFQSDLDAILANKNVLLFAASGDSASSGIVTKEIYPASLNGCVSVGASNGQNIADLTIRSTKTIIHAQGVGVAGYTLAPQPEPLNGTSVSVPIVAGIAALAVSYLKARNNGQWDADSLLQKIYDTATPVNGDATKKIINPIALFKQL